MTDVKRVHMKVLISITEDAEVLTPAFFESILEDVKSCFEERHETVAMLKGFDIEHLRRR